MTGHRFILGLGWRLVLLVAAGLAFAASLARPDLGAARLVAGLLVLAAAELGLTRASLYRRMEKHGL